MVLLFFAQYYHNHKLLFIKRWPADYKFILKRSYKLIIKGHNKLILKYWCVDIKWNPRFSFSKAKKIFFLNFKNLFQKKFCPDLFLSLSNLFIITIYSFIYNN